MVGTIAPQSEIAIDVGIYSFIEQCYSFPFMLLIAGGGSIICAPKYYYSNTLSENGRR